MSAFDDLTAQLMNEPKVWLVTGAAGFIGSNLVEQLLRLNQIVRGLDNFATGHKHNLSAVKEEVTPAQWANFTFREGDIRDLATCQTACGSVDYVLHQAALGSVPRSIEDPLTAQAANVTGFVHMLVAARDQHVKRFVFASSSAVYGDHPGLPKVESAIGQPLSPYAATKLANEIDAAVFARCYGLEYVGLRYFNVFGPRQDPEGPYAAVVPKWIAALIKKQPVFVNGDGETSRDFCYIANVVQANLLAATTVRKEAVNQIYNVAVHERTSLNQLYQLLRERLVGRFPQLQQAQPTYREFRAGDVRHSLADISKARELLGYQPAYPIASGLDTALDWYVAHS